MKTELISENYCATVVKLSRFIDLKGCDNIKAAIINGNSVIVSKSAQIGDIGLFFPVETQLSENFVKNNNLYRDNTLNLDTTKNGYIEGSRRIRCQKFRKHDSEGLFLELSCLNYIEGIGSFNIGDMFNKINDELICIKYVKPTNKTNGSVSKRERAKPKHKKINIVENQFRFHVNTPHFGCNVNRFELEDVIDISKKLHGTSCISSNILVENKVSLFEKWMTRVIDFFTNSKTNFQTYKNIYSSRTVIKNDNLDKSYYKVDVWGEANNRIKSLVDKGYSFYYEIVGYLPNTESYIQKDYDYGCEKGTFDIYIYRITHTDIYGKMIELSPKMIRDMCDKIGLKVVPLVYYGSVKQLLLENNISPLDPEWRDRFSDLIKDKWLEKECEICKNKVPAEGVVIRKDGLKLDVYKYKSTSFKMRETKNLDNDVVDIEEEA